MARSPKIFAKKLLIISLENGRINDERVLAVLQTLKDSPPRQYKAILQSYLLKVQAELRKENAILEHSGVLPEKTVSNIKDKLSNYYKREIEVATRDIPEMLAGVRVRVADDIWDTTVAGRLEQLKYAFKT